MATATRHSWRTPEMKDLFEAIASLETPQEAQHFLRDLCTLGELEAMAHRWHVARLRSGRTPRRRR